MLAPAPHALSDSDSTAPWSGGMEAPIPRMVMNEEGRFIYTSPAFAQMLRTTPAVLKGSKFLDLVIIHDPDRMFGKDGASRAVLSAIKPGTHGLRLRDCQDHILHFDFEWMQVGSGARFLVATLALQAPVATDPTSNAPTILELEHNDPLPDVVDLAEIPSLPHPARDQDITIPDALQALAQVAVPQPALVPATAHVPAAVSARAAFRAAQRRGDRSEGQIFLDLSDDLMIRLDPSGIISHANRAFYNVLGFVPHMGHPLNILDIVAPEDRSLLRGVLLDMANGASQQGRLDSEIRLVNAEGTRHIMNVRCKQHGDKIFMLCRDLTATRAREALVLEQHTRLAEAEAIAHMGYWRWDVGSDRTTWSDEIFRMFGVDRHDFTPTLQALRPRIKRHDLLRIIQSFERAMIERKPYGLEFCITRPDGQMRVLHCEGRTECNADGDVVALFGILQDTTERATSERELLEAKNAAERAYASKSKFLANMSHELRTPLNAIIGFSEMMARQILGPLGNQKYVEYLEGIRASGEHLLDLISDILDMSKIEAGKYVLDVEDLNVTKVMRLAVNMVEAKAREARITLDIQTPGHDIRAVADRRAVLQMMLNLMSNAVKFTPPGGTVTLGLEEDLTHVRFRVKDTGIGIPTHLLPVITKPFEQVANHYTRSHDGSGLGLAITKELVKLHQGDLRLTSAVGVGTEVVIEIPRG